MARQRRSRTEDGDDSRIRDRERTKARIVQAATDLFTLVGPTGASLDDISRKAGVARGLIYHYFKTKEQLFEQVLARPLADLFEHQLAFIEGRLDVAGLCRGTEVLFKFFGRHPDMVRLIGWTLAMRRLTGDLPQLEITRALFARMVRRIDEAKAEGLLRPDLDARHLLITILDLTVAWHLSRDEWCTKLAWTDRDPRDLDDERLAAILDVVTHVASPRPHPLHPKENV